MRIPIRNKGDRPITLFIEVLCDQYEIPAGGEALVQLEDGRPHSIDLHDGWVTIWDEGSNASVEVISSNDKRVDEALMLVRVWLHGLGAIDEALWIDAAVESFESTTSYFIARDQVFRAFYWGFMRQENMAPDDTTLSACYRAGSTAARLNDAARKAQSFPDLGAAPFDTNTVRSAFEAALSNVR